MLKYVIGESLLKSSSKQKYKEMLMYQGYKS